MKIKIGLILCLLIVECVSPKCQNIYFNNKYNNDDLSSGRSIIETESGYVILGVSGVASGEYIFLRNVVTSIDFEGNQLWWKTYGEDFHNYYGGDVRSADRTHDGGFVLGGAIEDTVIASGLLIRFDQDGDSLWARTWGDTSYTGYNGTAFRVVRELPDHGFILAGSVFVSGDDSDVLIVRTDSLGNTIWYKVYGLLHIIEDCYAIDVLPDGGFLFGTAKVNINLLNSSNPGMLKVDSLGNKVWWYEYGSYMDDYGAAVAHCQDGNYLFGSTYAIEEPGPWEPRMKVRILKLNTDGGIIWDRKYSSCYFMGSTVTIDELPNGDIIAAGEGGFCDSYNMQGYIIKVKPNGDSIWMRRYDYYHLNLGFMNDLYDMQITSDDGLIITGEVFGEPEWQQSIWVQKLDSIGCDTAGCDPTVGMDDLIPLASNFDRVTIYPNPASDLVHILFRDDRPDWFLDRKIEIINMFGELVMEREVPHLSDNYGLNVTNLSLGLYLLVVKERQKVVYTAKLLISR